MSAIKVKKLCLEDLEKQYDKKTTRKTYRGLWKRLIDTLNEYPTEEENGKTGIVFKDIEEYENCIKNCQKSFNKESMKQEFFGMFGGLAKRFRYPQVYGLDIGFKPQPHKGFTQDERRRILKYCLSDENDNVRLMCISKFTTLVLLETGLRADEFRKFMEVFVENHFVKQCMEAENLEEVLRTHDNSYQTVPIRGKGSTPRKITITENIIRVGKKVITSEKSICYRISVTNYQVANRLHFVLDRLGIAGLPHDCRVSFATRLWELGVPIETIQVALGHANVEQTRKYIRCYNTSLTVGNAMSKSIQE